MYAANRLASILALATLGLVLALLMGGSSLDGVAQGEAASQPVGQSDGMLSPFATITVSGTITGPGGPVPDVWIGVGSPQDWQDTTTDSSGSYSATIQTDGSMWFDVRPEIETRLIQFGFWMDGVSADFRQDFTLTAGHLLRVEIIGRDGQPITDGNTWISVERLITYPPLGYYYTLPWNAEKQCYETVLPPDIYYLQTHNTPGGYYPTTAVFDLRPTDLITELLLNTSYVHPVPYDPPDASKLTFGSPDDLGEVEITGAPGAVLPLAHVLLGNVNSTHQAHVISEGDGSFSARLYAPPGSAVLVRHGPASDAWRNVDMHGGDLQRFPGTIINLPHTHAAEAGYAPFAAVGAVSYIESQVAPPTPGSVGAAWALTGSIGKPPARVEDPVPASPSLTFAPGDPFEINVTIRIHGQAITASADLSAIAIFSQVSLMMIYDQQGHPVGSENYDGSNRLTPSGFPIRSAERPVQGLGIEVPATDLHHLEGHALEGSLVISGHVPADLPSGVYRPLLRIQCIGVPTSTQWLSGKQLENYRTFDHDEVDLPPIVVASSVSSEDASVSTRRLIWRLLRNTPVQGTRGTGAREDEALFQSASFIVAQGAPYIVPSVDVHSGEPITYRLEPFLPMISYSERRTPAPPLIPFDLPGGQLCVVIQEPDGSTRDLGCGTFSQSFIRAMTTRGGEELNSNSVQVADVYSLMTASDQFRVQFDQYGHHVITMTGTIEDIWGNSYDGGGTYNVWVAYSLDIDPGVLPGTPLAVGDALNPAVQVYPRVPAQIEFTVTLYPNSDPEQVITHTVSGQANSYGYFGSDCSPLTMPHPGEYRGDLTAIYTDTSGEVYMGAMTWGSIVMTPPEQAQLRAHGQRGPDVWNGIAPQWILFNDPCIGEGGHLFNPYFNGDIIWSRTSDVDCSGDSLILVATMEDTAGAIAPTIQQRYERMNPCIYGPWEDFATRISVGQIPTFSSTRSGLAPQMVQDDQDQICYSYQYSERPGVRVREDVTESCHQGSGYWRFDDLYDYQLGVGVEGDLPNDYKYQYVGVVFRDLESGHSEYLGQGTGWVHLPDDDSLGSRVMPPFAGPGNGGWTTQGGAIMTLEGEDIHIFILPTGTRPGAVLQVGDTFHFAGHIMPTLDSQVAVTVTAPGGTQYLGGGQANHVGYFYDPDDDFVVDEPGLWSVDVRVWHDGQCSGGATIPPYPSGDVLGSEDGRYWFYVVPGNAPRLQVSSPSPGFLSFEGEVTPITITGSVPAGLSGVTVDYTISMPGYILEQDRVTPSGDTYQITFDPAALYQDFPNLDLIGRDERRVGLVDTFAIGLLLRGQSHVLSVAEGGNSTVYRANTITIQGEQVFVGDALSDLSNRIYLPLILRN